MSCPDTSPSRVEANEVFLSGMLVPWIDVASQAPQFAL
jgi:hypothetical protein